MRKTLLKKTLLLCLAVLGFAIEGFYAFPVKAAESEVVAIPKTYTYKNIQTAKDLNGSMPKTRHQRMLAKDAEAIMENNRFFDDNAADNREIDLTNLLQADYRELNSYSLALINSVRRQMGLKQLSTNSNLQRVAQDVADGYVRDNRGDDNGSHDVKAIYEASRANGLIAHKSYNDKEDMTGFWFGPRMSILHAKHNIYWAIRDLYSGFFPQACVVDNTFREEIGRDAQLEHQYKNMKQYQEFGHARDLSSKDINQGAVSFSSRNGDEVTFHIITIGHQDIVNANKFYR